MTTALEKTSPQETVPAANESRPKQPRIVIIGGGFAGIAAARALRGCDADVILIDRRNHHIFQPLLYQVATAVLPPSDVDHAQAVGLVSTRRTHKTGMPADQDEILPGFADRAKAQAKSWVN
jgi:2-polyprenyl-6-methoxyphenol hydroxylase-like FAD-dependent oxidoreductase